MGPLTGRGAGYCAGYNVPGYANPGFGGGFGMGRGRGGWGGGGRGWRNQFYATGMPGWMRYGAAPAWGASPVAPVPGPEQEAEYLRAQAEQLQAELDAISERLSELEGGK
jgi:uncharacterized protein DUF5320